MSEAENTAVEPTIQPAELETAPASVEQAEPEKVVFSDDQQKVFNDMAAKKAFEARTAKREADDLRKQLEEMKANVPRETRPNVPDVPDPYEDDYETRLRERDDAIRASAAFDAGERVRQEHAQREQQTAAHTAQTKQNERVQSYADRAKTLGMTPAELESAGTRVNQFGIDNAVANLIISDDQGPLITKYLSENPVEMETLSSMDAMSAGIRIATVVKQKAAALGNKQRNAPDPAETLRGAGVSTSNGGPDGASYE